jgi:RHS repeat-associated protein
MVVNTSGAQVAKRSYLPFGGQWAASGSLPTDFGFTGQREADEIGLYYYVARWLDPEIGHFVQADTIVPGAGNPAAYNRYGYVGYNPIRYTDPSGHIPISDSKAYFDFYYQLQCQGSRYCELANGAVVDWTHFNTTEATKLIEKLERGEPTITLSQGSIGYEFSVTFQINYVDGVTTSSLAAGIWIEFQQMFEVWQTEVYALDFTGTGQSPEDVPSTYLAFLAVANNLGNDRETAQAAIVAVYGGGVGMDEKPTWLRGFSSDNYQFQIPDGAGGYNSLPYPEELNIAPAANQGYWGVVSVSSRPDWPSIKAAGTFLISESIRWLVNGYGPGSINPLIPFP